MTTPDIVWGSLIAGGLAYEAWTLGTRKQGDTLSETTRKAFRLRTSRAGRRVFLVGYLAFFGWWFGHLMDWWW